MKQEFESKLERPEGIGTWTYCGIPFDVEEIYGSKGQVKVKGTVNGIPYRSSLMPSGDGTHYLVINKSIREAAGVKAGDPVHVTTEPDLTPRTLEISEDLAKALEENETALHNFERFSYSHQKAYLDWISEAKKPETRTARIRKAILMLSEGTKLK